MKDYYFFDYKLSKHLSNVTRVNLLLIFSELCWNCPFPFLATGGQCSAAVQTPPPPQQMNQPNTADSLETPVFLHSSLPTPLLLFILPPSLWRDPLFSFVSHKHVHNPPPRPKCTISTGIFLKVGGPCGAMSLEESTRTTYTWWAENLFPFVPHPSFLNCLLTFVLLPPGCML